MENIENFGILLKNLPSYQVNRRRAWWPSSVACSIVATEAPLCNIENYTWEGEGPTFPDGVHAPHLVPLLADRLLCPMKSHPLKMFVAKVTYKRYSIVNIINI